MTTWACGVHSLKASRRRAGSDSRATQESATRTSPENMALLGEDRSVILNFLAELDPFEREVSQLTAEGLRYGAIAKRLGVDVSKARRAARSVERKRIQFRLRHDLDWEPHSRARRAGSMLVAPLPAITAGLVSARRWLFGQGIAAKAGAAVAVAAMATAGALHAPAPAPRPASRGAARKTAPSARNLSVPQQRHVGRRAPTVVSPHRMSGGHARRRTVRTQGTASAGQTARPRRVGDTRS